MISLTIEAVSIDKSADTKDVSVVCYLGVSYICYLCVLHLLSGCVLHLISQHVMFLRQEIPRPTKHYFGLNCAAIVKSGIHID